MQESKSRGKKDEESTLRLCTFSLPDYDQALPVPQHRRAEKQHCVTATVDSTNEHAALPRPRLTLMC